jgi:hypothetical protein
MSLVVVTGVKALRVPNQGSRALLTHSTPPAGFIACFLAECLTVWEQLRVTARAQIGDRALDDFLEYPLEAVQGADLPNKETFLEVHHVAGLGTPQSPASPHCARFSCCFSCFGQDLTACSPTSGFRDSFKFEITFDCREPGIPDGEDAHAYLSSPPLTRHLSHDHLAIRAPTHVDT